jgi:hypothetical protein
MKRQDKPKRTPIALERADPAELAKFDPDLKICTMNCGPHIGDPRSEIERRFLCTDCKAKP